MHYEKQYLKYLFFLRNAVQVLLAVRAVSGLTFHSSQAAGFSKTFFTFSSPVYCTFHCFQFCSSLFN